LITQFTALKCNISKNKRPVMAQPLQLAIAGAIYHLTSRGNARQKVFSGHRPRAVSEYFIPGGRLLWLDLLGYVKATACKNKNF
jgi:hypothetical protein